MDLATSRRRLALFGLFLIPGLALSSWVTRTPDIRDLLGASTAEMGLVLFGLSAGSMIGILSSGALVTRFGTKPVIAVAALTIVSCTPVVGLGAAMSQSIVVAAGLFLLGLGFGGGEVAMNVDGADVERIISRPVLPMMHGSFSLGTVVGALIGMLFTKLEVPVVWHLGGMALVTLPLCLFSLRWVPGGTGREEQHAAKVPGPPVWRDRRLLLIGVIVLGMALAEGAANDWLPLIMVDGHGLDPALSSGVYVVFVAAMTIGRFTGGFFLDRFGRAAVLCASAIIGAVGLAVVIAVDSPIAAGAAVLLWGLGSALGFPVALSAAGDSGANPTARVSLVATVGYVAFLVGPPGLGFLGEHFGLRGAMLVVLAFLVAAAAAAPALGGRKPAAAAL
ncbi:MFS transporter [Paractinoplanes durhamensis]|uniref:MFS transporter n=1 Tax=Paractinoplanes durhamensis TaxID=113563 RepID=A0ABQ3YRE0_9ACTN|nr:MFS transporter [Actinoplanes durhamensis]GID99938.1 MFS transporter [Actinoplanes durhamensis]